MATSANDNIIAYVRDEKRPFSEIAPTDVDALVFSALAYASFETVPAFPSEQPVRIGDLLTYGAPADYMGADCNPCAMEELLEAAVRSPRFSPVLIENPRALTDESRVIQFGAVSFRVSDRAAVIAFRGTDTSLVGWHEDLLMLSQPAMPSQTEALDYVRHAIKAHPETTYLVCGHSKGGSCAEYAALFLTERFAAHVDRAISFDGPALSRIGNPRCPELASYDEDLEDFYRRCAVPFTRYLFASEVGLTLEYRDFDRFRYVACTDASRPHNVCSQKVVDGSFVLRVPPEQEMWDGLLFTRFARLASVDERKLFADLVIGACREAGIVPDLSAEGKAALKSALRAHMHAIDPAERAAALRLLACFKRAAS